MQGVGIIICSRSDSRRVPNKPFVQINGRAILEHLIHRLIPSGIHIYLAVPHFDYQLYKQFSKRFEKKDVTVICGPSSDPLARMAIIAQEKQLDTVIRICHDKIFVQPEKILEAVEVFQKSKLDYLYSSQFVDGSGFEVISQSALVEASSKFHDVEHVGYAIHCVTDRISKLSLPNTGKPHRLLIDYPEDLKVMDLVLTNLGNDCTLGQALRFLDQNPFISEINRLPLITAYTCAYNSEKWINQAMGSVAAQEGFKGYEYLLVDDFSKDETAFLMSQFCSIYKNTRWIRNQANLGLASSSNVALSQARGKYIIRLDADDYFVDHSALKTLLEEIEASGDDVIYPDNYFGSFKTIQSGSENHHVGGALFRTRAANHVKFTEGLRGYEGYDFFERAKDVLKIGYHKKPLFFYRQHENSLTKGDPHTREQIRKQIDETIASSVSKNR